MLKLISRCIPFPRFLSYQVSFSSNNYYKSSEKQQGQILAINNTFLTIKTIDQIHNYQKQKTTLNTTQIINIIRSCNQLILQKKVQLKSQEFLNLCINIQSKINNFINLSPSQTLEMRDFIYTIAQRQTQRIKNIPNLVKKFQSNFIRHYQGQKLILPKNHQFILDLFKYYIILANNPQKKIQILKQLAKNIISNLNSLSLSNLSTNLIEPMIQILEIGCQSYDISQSQQDMCDIILGKLYQVHDKLTQINHMNIYFSITKSILFLNKGLKLAQLNFIIVQKMMKNLSQLKQDSILHFISKCPLYNFSIYFKLFSEVLNWYLIELKQKDLKDASNIMFVLQMFLTAAKRSPFPILNTKSIQVYIQFLKTVIRFHSQTLDQTIKLNIQQKLLLLFKYQFVNASVAGQMLINILGNETLAKNTKLIYRLTQIGVVHKDFIKNIVNFQNESNLKLIDNLENAITISIYISQIEKLNPFLQNILQTHPVQIQYMRTVESKTIQYAKQLGKIQNFLSLYQQLKGRPDLLNKFHTLFHDLYLNQLMGSINPLNILRFLEYFILSQNNREMIKLCKNVSFLQSLSIQTVINLIQNFNVEQSNNRIVINMIILISSSSQHISRPDLQRAKLKRILNFLLKPQIIQSINVRFSFQLMKIMESITSHLTSPRNARDVENFIFFILKREYSKLHNNQDYLQYIKWLLEFHLRNINGRYLIRKIITLGLQFNCLSFENCKYIKEKEIKFGRSGYQQLFNVIYANFLGNFNQIKISSTQVIKSPMIAFRHREISQQQLKELERNIMTGIGRAQPRQLYQCIILFQLPKMKQNYHLTFLTKIIQRLNTIVYGFERSIIFIAIQSLVSILKFQPYNINPQLPPINISQLSSSRRQNLYSQIRNFVYKTVNLITPVTNTYLNKNVNNISISAHMNLLDLCFWFDIVHISYFKTVLNYCMEVYASASVHVDVMTKVSKMVLVTDHKYIQNMQGLFRNYLTQVEKHKIIFFLFKSSSNPQQYLRSFLQSSTKIDPIFLAYIQKIYPKIYTTASEIQLDENGIVLSSPTHIQKLQQLYQNAQKSKQDSDKDMIYEIIRYGKSIKLFMYTLGNIKKIFGILAGAQKNQSVTLIQGLKNIISELQQIKIQNVYILNEHMLNQFITENQEQNPTIFNLEIYLSKQTKQIRIL